MSSVFKDTLPAELVTHVTAICGERGAAWIEELPELIALLEKQWNLKVEQPFPGIEFNYVAAASRSNGEQVVVKISPPFERVEIFQEAKYLQTRDGAGVVKVLDVDRKSKAILLERAIPGQALFRHFENEPTACIKPAVDVMLNILRPVPPDLTDVERLDNWFARFQRYKTTSFHNDLSAKASDIYYRLSKQRGRTYYIHGDFHPGNIVTSDRSKFLAIDPKGIVGHVGYDVAVFLNNLHWWRRSDRDVNAILQTAVRQFSEALMMTEAEVREWAFACMVIGAWWNFEDMPEHYDGGLAISDIWGV